MTDATGTTEPTPEMQRAERQPSRAEKRAKWWAETKLDLKWATALLFVLVLSLSGALWTSWKAPTNGEEDLTDVSDSFFSTGRYDPASPDHAPAETEGGVSAQPGLVAPFELLSVLLLAALIAGVVIALRDVGGSN